jgi:hypothetical protein
MALTYFAGDGSYGDASGLVIIDTRAWNNDQWDRVESASDYERAAIAASIALENGSI